MLVAAAVVALALVPMAFAYLQLGYHGDVGTGVEPESELLDAERSLDRAVEHASAEVAGEYDWEHREEAVSDFRSTLSADANTIERLGHGDGVVVEIVADREPVTDWSQSNCPSDPMRAFGPCDAVGNVVVQERGGETAVLAAAFRLHVATPDGESTVAVVAVVFEQ